LAAVIAATNFAVVQLGRVAITDPTLWAFVALANYAVIRLLFPRSGEAGLRQKWLSHLFFAATALAVLTKGPVALALVQFALFYQAETVVTGAVQDGARVAAGAELPSQRALRVRRLHRLLDCQGDAARRPVPEPLPDDRVPDPLLLPEDRVAPLRLDDAAERERELVLRFEDNEAARERVPLDDDPEDAAERVRERFGRTAGRGKRCVTRC